VPPIERPSPTIEDYLGAIYTLARDQQPVYGRRLAEWMEVSPPTVTVTIQRMVRDGWVIMEPDKTIHLTDAGRVAAASLVRRHMLTELLLARVLNVPWSQVHAEADRLEHGLSAETAARVAALLDGTFEDGTIACPHGNPLPGQEDEIGQSFPLTDVPLDSEYVLCRVHEEAERDSVAMALLEEHGLLPGTRLWLRPNTTEDTDGAILLAANGVDISLTHNIARCLWVREA